MSLTIENLKEYSWNQLWNQLNHDMLNDSEKLVKAFLFSYLLTDNIASNEVLKTVKDNTSAEYYWVNTMVKLFNEESSDILKDITLCQKCGLSSDFLQWTIIEYYGVSKQYENQAIHFMEAISGNETYPYIAFINSLGNGEFSSKHILKYYNLDTITKKSTLEKLLFKIKILNNLKLYKEIEIFILDIISENVDNSVVSKLSYILYKNNLNQNQNNDKSLLLQIAAKPNFLSFNDIIDWLTLALSNKTEFSNVEDVVQLSLSLVPNNIKYKGTVISFAMMHFWVKGDMDILFQIINQFLEYCRCESKNQAWVKAYFLFISLLHCFYIDNKELYNSAHNSKKLYVLGESHSLTLSKLHVSIDGKKYQCESLLIIGAKMFHLKRELDNKYTNSFIKYINSIDKNSTLMITIGEIDCRYDSGIFNAYQNTNQNIDDIIYKTVTEYLDFIKYATKEKYLDMLIIQGIPYPKYPMDKDIKLEVISMIEKVNILLREKVLEKGWSFLDILSPSILTDYIDTFHLEPSFYKKIDDYLIR